MSIARSNHRLLLRFIDHSVPPAGFNQSNGAIADEDAWEEMWKEVRAREEGALPPNSFASRIRSRRTSSLELSQRKEIVSPHHGAVNSLQVSLLLFPHLYDELISSIALTTKLRLI